MSDYEVIKNITVTFLEQAGVPAEHIEVILSEKPASLDDHPAMPDIDDRREAYYQWGYPPYPLY